MDAAQTGYDDPLPDKSRDDLDRWRFAADLLRVMNRTPRKWSVRTGVLGKWGEGKTTALRFSIAWRPNKTTSDFGSIHGLREAWDELWTEFMNRFLQALTKRMSIWTASER